MEASERQKDVGRRKGWERGREGGLVSNTKCLLVFVKTKIETKLDKPACCNTTSSHLSLLLNRLSLTLSVNLYQPPPRVKGSVTCNDWNRCSFVDFCWTPQESITNT